jgi:hypothetical protein
MIGLLLKTSLNTSAPPYLLPQYIRLKFRLQAPTRYGYQPVGRQDDSNQLRGELCGQNFLFGTFHFCFHFGKQILQLSGLTVEEEWYQKFLALP